MADNDEQADTELLGAMTPDPAISTKPPPARRTVDEQSISPQAAEEQQDDAVSDAMADTWDG